MDSSQMIYYLADFFKLIVAGAIAGIFAAVLINYLPNLNFYRSCYKFQRDVKNKVNQTIIYEDATVLELYLIEAAHNYDYNRVVKIIIKILKEINDLDSESYSAILGKLQKFVINFADDDYIMDRLITTVFIFFNNNRKYGRLKFARYEEIFSVLVVIAAQKSSDAQKEIGIFLTKAITPEWLNGEGDITKIRYISILCQYAASMPKSSHYRIDLHLKDLLRRYPRYLVEMALEYNWQGQELSNKEQLSNLKLELYGDIE